MRQKDRKGKGGKSGNKKVTFRWTDGIENIPKKRKMKEEKKIFKTKKKEKYSKNTQK